MDASESSGNSGVEIAYAFCELVGKTIREAVVLGEGKGQACPLYML